MKNIRNKTIMIMINRVHNKIGIGVIMHNERHAKFWVQVGNLNTSRIDINKHYISLS